MFAISTRMRCRLVKTKHSTDFCFGVLHSFQEPTLAPILRGTCDCDPCVAGGIDNSLGAGKSLSLKSFRFYGFTLLELLVALAITAVLWLIVVPTYQTFINQSHRVTAQTDLTACAQALWGSAGSTMSYLNFADTNGDGLGNADEGPIASEICRPVSHAQGNYLLSIRGSGSEFSLTARAMGDDTSSGILGLSSTGAKLWDENGDGVIELEDNDWLAADDS